MRETIKTNTVNTNTNSINWGADLVLNHCNIDNIFAPDIRSTTTERPADGTPTTLKVGDRTYPAVWETVDTDGLYLRVKNPEVGMMVIPPTRPAPETRYRMLQEGSRFLWELLSTAERAERERIMRAREKALDKKFEEQWEKEVEELTAEIFRKECSAARGSYLEPVFRAACAKLARAKKAFKFWGPDEYSWSQMERLSGLCARTAYEEAQKEFNALLDKHREELMFLAEPIRIQADKDCWGSACSGCNWWGHATKPCAACGRC